MSKLTQARGGLLFDVVTSSLQDVNQCQLIMAGDKEFDKFVMAAKFDCQKILKAVEEYEAARKEVVNDVI